MFNNDKIKELESEIESLKEMLSGNAFYVLSKEAEINKKLNDIQMNNAIVKALFEIFDNNYKCYEYIFEKLGYKIVHKDDVYEDLLEKGYKLINAIDNLVILQKPTKK